MDGPEASTVTRCHVLVEAPDSIRPAKLPELLVHVMRTRARVVAEPDAEVLHTQRAAFVDHVHANDLAVRLLNLLELAQEVPETRLRDDVVRREDTHAVELRRGVGLSGQVAAHDLVFLEAHLEEEARSVNTSKT